MKQKLLRDNLDDWQTIQCDVAIPPIAETLSFLFDALHPAKKPVVSVIKNKQAVDDALKIVGNVHKIVELDKIFKQIKGKIGIKQQEKLCKLLVLRQYLLFTIENMDDEELENNVEFKNLIRQFGPIQKSDVPYDEGLLMFPISINWRKILMFLNFYLLQTL